MMKCICVRAGKYICAARGVRGQSRPYDRLLDRRTAALGGFMNENKVNGNIDGVRQSAIDRLREVYDIQVEGDCFAPPEIIERMAAFTAICNREVSVYISRDGRVMDITVGGPESVPLKSLRLRRNPGRLSMIRCIHTHPEGEARLSGVDRQALRSMNFDAMAAISVRGGKAREIGVGFLVEMGAGGAVEVIEPPCVPVGRIPQEEWMHEIALADGRVRAWSGLESDEERALLISVDSAESLDELAALTDTAGGVVIERVLQRLPKPDPATYIGSGKVEELSLTAQALDIDICIFDDELTGAQLRNLEEGIGVRCIDRTGLILDIFAQRARSREGKLQVELAQLQYRLPRLTGQGTALSRLAGGIGTRGPGESKLEQDRRYIRRRIADVNAELKELIAQRELQRRQRQKNGVPVVALVGYTNAGKSTLLNRLSGADVLAEDKLFATLDTTTRQLSLPDNQSCLLIDTVGFINKLPHELVSAFKATLEEVVKADLLVVVSDASNPEWRAQRKVVGEVLAQLGAGGKPVIEAFNKCDNLTERMPLPKSQFYVSARTGEGLDELLREIQSRAAAMLHRVRICVPYSKGQLVSRIHEQGNVISEEYDAEGTVIIATLDQIALDRISRELPVGGVELLGAKS